MPEELQGDESSQGYGLPKPIPYVPYASSPQLPGVPSYIGSGEANALPPVPPALSSPPQASIVSGGSSVQKRSRQGRWITISILAVLLIAAVASFFVIRYVSRSTPDKTLDAFCNALQQADYRSAYDQFSAKLQHTVSEAAFAAAFSQDKVTACTHGTTGNSANSVTNDLKLVHASKGINNDIVTLTKDSNSDWKIDDIYRQT
jgi:flagellar basal body-associated protein FliL